MALSKEALVSHLLPFHGHEVRGPLRRHLRRAFQQVPLEAPQLLQNRGLIGRVGHVRQLRIAQEVPEELQITLEVRELGP